MGWSGIPMQNGLLFLVAGMALRVFLCGRLQVGGPLLSSFIWNLSCISTVSTTISSVLHPCSVHFSWRSSPTGIYGVLCFFKLEIVYKDTSVNSFWLWERCVATGLVTRPQMTGLYLRGWASPIGQTCLVVMVGESHCRCDLIEI